MTPLFFVCKPVHGCACTCKPVQAYVYQSSSFLKNRYYIRNKINIHFQRTSLKMPIQTQ